MKPIAGPGVGKAGWFPRIDGENRFETAARFRSALHERFAKGYTDFDGIEPIDAYSDTRLGFGEFVTR